VGSDEKRRGGRNRSDRSFLSNQVGAFEVTHVRDILKTPIEAKEELLMRTICLTLVVALSVIVAPSCNSRSDDNAPDQGSDTKAMAHTAKPSATEIFHLRTECAQLSAKILKDKNDELEPFMSTKTYAWWHQISEKSHYSPETNRCYVELTMETTSRHDQQYDAWYQDLYDGQTKESLAHTEHIVNNGSFPKKEDSGMIYVSTVRHYDDSYSGASSYISEMMKDDRTE
jgi:hypothetical protein